MRAKEKSFRKTDRNVYSDNHGQIIWDEHVKNNIFLKYIIIISFTKSTPSRRNNVDVHLNYHGKNCDTCGQQHCDRGAGNTSVHTSE